MGTRPPRRSLVILVALVCVACGGEGASPRAPTVEALGEAVFESIRDHDVEGVLAYLMTPDDAEWVIARTEQATASDERRTKELRRAASDEGRQEAREDWEKIHARAEGEGIVWSKTVFDEVTHDARELWPGVHAGRAYLTFRHGEARYVIRLGEAVLKIEDRWVLLPEARWQGKERD